MISNNTSYKYKSSKGPREPIEDYTHSDDNFDTNSIDGDLENGHRYHGYGRDNRFRGSNRARPTEFRSSRANDRRGAYRSRGAPSRGRGDRDGSDNYYILNRKYHDTLRHSEAVGSYGKFYEPEKKIDIKLNLPEDTRISKLLRRLSIETDQENSLAISKKLLEVLLLPDNALYVRKAFHILGESMFEIIQVSPGSLAKQQAARALGRMGYIMGQENDFERYQNWLFLKMGQTYDEIQILFMKSLKETLAFEKSKAVLQEHAENILHNLVTSLETIENAEVFKAILDVLISVIEIYPDCFYTQFRDTIDLLFGWHVDHTQPLTNIEFISRNLQRISQHFKYNLEFSLSLVDNFLEDITNYSNQLNDSGEAISLEHLTVLILALNTVVKCLGSSFKPTHNKQVKIDLIISCLNQIIKTTTDSLEKFVHDNLIIAANEGIGILLGHLDNKTQNLSQLIYNLIDLELSLINEFSNSTIISMLLLIAKVIKELSANLPVELIEKLIGPHAEIVKLRYSQFKSIQDSVVCVYQALLNVKNVSLLQEAYRYVLGDFEVVYKQIIPSIEPFIQNNPFENQETVDGAKELTVLFLLRCLSQLANASSIIVMWALKPSILELVGVNLEPFNEQLAKDHPALQYSLVFLLYQHCKCYNHFISSSNLVAQQQVGIFALSEGLNVNDVPNTSPNSGNFEIILDILYKTLSIRTTSEVTLLMLQWLNDILVNSDSYLESLYNNEKFLPVTEALVNCGYHFNVKIVQAVCDNLEKLLENKQLSLNYQFLTSICDLCKLHMNSNNEIIRKRFSKLSANIPWDIALVEFNYPNLLYNEKKKCIDKDYNNYMIGMVQYLNLNSTNSSNMYPMQFKKFMNYLLTNTNEGDCDWLEDIFISCFNSQMDLIMVDCYYDLTINSKVTLNNWLTLDAAQFCVNYKLRTPLGKPNETFTKIEGALNQLGNDLINLKKDKEMNEGDFGRVVLLLQFVEYLEKTIYNASEGCAISMLQPVKPVRSFFIANTNTCHEWICRIRTVIIHIALHAGDPSMALRHGQALLGDLLASGKSSSVEFERIVMFITLALLNLREPEAICGLYCWSKNITGRKFSWVKCAAEQASKKYELAIEGYKKILNEQSVEVGKKILNEHSLEVGGDDVKRLDVEIYQFISDQIIICHQELHNWIELLDWRNKDMPLQSSENGRRYWFSTTNWDCTSNLSNVEMGIQALTEMNSWTYKAQPESWSKYNTITTLESNLYGLAFTLAKQKDSDEKVLMVLSSLIVSSIEWIEGAVRDQLDTAPSKLLQNLLLMQYVGYGLKHVINGSTNANAVFLVSENFENEINKIDSSTLKKILWWAEYFANIQNQTYSTFCNNLRLHVIKRARKERNFKLAFGQINKFLKDKDIMIINDNENLTQCLLDKLKEINIWNNEIARSVTEIIKLSYQCDSNKHNTFNLCAAASTAISKHAELYGGVELRKVSSKILLKLANWLQITEDVSITEIGSPLGKLLMVLPEIGTMENNVSNIIPLNEMAIGKLLQFSVHQCVSLAKSWNYFGTWCYRWGRKIVDQSCNIQNNLTDDDCASIKTLLPPLDTTDEDLANIFKILSQTRSNIDEEDIESNDIKTSEMIQNQLKFVNCLRNAPETVLLSLVQIWRDTQKRIYTYYSLSAEAYFKYLHLTMNSENITNNTECNMITVTLRLLRLIVKYALELQIILEEGLQTTPTQPWKVIIPQLFSRLNHPESYVRHRVSDLLCRIAEDAPHLITFPAVVGALEGGLKFDFSEITLPKDCLSQNNEANDDNELNEDEDNYDSDNEDSSSALQSCFKTMVDTLSKQDPETISQVQTLVKELRRITLLWDELWLGTLAQHQTEISKRQQQLELEIEKVNSNSSLSKEEKHSLIAEKHRIIIKPIVFILEQLQQVTSVDAETPHEKQFQEKYLKEIHDVIEKLKHPDNPNKSHESLQPLKQLQKQFQQKFHRRASYTLRMQDISPVLATIKNTLIAMPGLATSARTTVAISHVSNIVSILPTKTKPKKLIFYGSDGHTYTYLFKGLEDLHLDERIMQFLSISNTLMAHIADPTSGYNLYQARHYSVIPLGPRSGLISWVDGTTPVFALYKRWQQREIVKPNSKTTNNANTNTTSVLRPSELFYNKLNPLLNEHNVKNIDNRKEWPLAVLKQVLTELMAETPSDLLAKELWCNSISASNWWQVLKKYSYSVAVMSIIGYIIGLGDRHLDNMLIDLTSGEIVHIDYNVCFEKGKTLRVPEKVPFRLTPNIRDALGVTGVEGIFRLACENVLKTMRKGRETLLTLLEAFVYDPLIDWTVGGEVLAGTSFGLKTGTNSKKNKKELEKEVTISMFNVRCMEIKSDWNENKENILKNVPFLVENLKLWLDIKSRITETEDYLQDLHQQMALVKEAEAHGINKHSLCNLPIRYESHCKTQEAMKTAKKDLDKIMADCEQHILSYTDALKLLDSEQFAKWLSDLNVNNDSTNIFDLVKEFLHNAGKNEIITQCEQSENDVDALARHQNISIQRCLQLLQEYHAILTQCPKSFMEHHRMYKFLQWSKFMIDQKTVDSCDEVYESFRTFLDLSNSQQILQFTYSLEAFYKESVTQVNKMYEDLKKMFSPETSATREKLYNNAKIGVKNFLASEKGATNAFQFVIANELVMLNKNFLTLETAASRSGDLLIKLTSRDGDWFLDDLVLNSTRAVEMINNLPLTRNLDGDDLVKILNGITIANNVYKGLRELHFNFHTIILPESMKKIQSEEISVIQMIDNLKGLIAELDQPIPDVISQLEKILPCLFMQMDINPSYELILEKVATIRTNFHQVVHTQSADPLRPGKMLLMGFNGLFDKLSQEINNLVQTLSDLDIPQSWKKLDQVKEAKSIAAHIFDPKVHAILDDIFLLKRLQAMYEFFSLVQEMCESFRGNGKCIVFSDEQLVKPVRQFIADFISRLLLGITTEGIAYSVCFILQDLTLNVTHEIEQKDIGAESKVPLDELCHKAWNHLLKTGIFTQNVVSQASSLETNLKSAWEKIQEPKKIELKLQVLQSSMLRLQSQLTVYNFMHEEILTQLNVYSTVRSKFILDLKKEMSTLTAIAIKLEEGRTKQKTLIDNAHQRLNWAKGANPNVLEIAAAFDNAVRIRDKKLNLESGIATDILNCCKIISQHELLRTHCLESQKNDKIFLNSFEKWRIACQYTSSKVDIMTTSEENIMNLLNADILKSPKWLQDVSDMISNLISENQLKLDEEKANLFTVFDAIITSIDQKFRPNYSAHCKLMSDVKSLIKTMTKIEDFSVQTQEFIMSYRFYNEKFVDLLAKFKRETTLDEIKDALECLNYIEDNTEIIYRNLLGLVEEKNDKKMLKDSVDVGKTNKDVKGQQRNAYAVSVWRRVKMKLEGRDPDPGRKYTPQEQVDYVIREAINLDNLALLYEGWTPWV